MSQKSAATAETSGQPAAVRVARAALWRSARFFALAAPFLMLVVGLQLAACVDKKKPKKEPRADLSQYVVAEPPKGIKKLDVNFDGKVTLLGYQLKSKPSLKPGDKVSYTLYWKSEKPLQDGWKLFTHVLNEKNKRVLNIDAVGPLRDYGKSKEPALPPSEWKPGKVYVDEQSFTVPKAAAGQRVRLVTGIWKGDDRLKVVEGPNGGENRALITTLVIGGGKEKAEAKVPELRVDRLAKGQKIKIDGKLDEEAWKSAASTPNFVNVQTGEADPKSPVQGKAKLTWDEQNLYVAFEVKDIKLVGGFDKTAKDPHLWTKDTVELMIDPDGNGDNKDYYEIQVGPQNLVFDSRFDDYNKPNGGKDGPFGNQDWSAKLESAVVLDGTLDDEDDDKGYTVEIKIPWQSFDKAKAVPPALGQTWRINLYAMQDNGGVAWSPILGQGNFHKASRFGRILFAEQGWEPPAPVPSASASISADAVRDAALGLKVGAPAPSGSVRSVSSAPRPLGPRPPGAHLPRPPPPLAQ
jgi:hypothetical protein